MKSLFKKLLSKPVKDTLTGHIEWLEELDGTDDLTALQTITERLSKLRDDILISDEEKRLAILMRVDEHSNTRIHKVLHQYIKFENLRPELEARISDISYYYFRQLFLNYRKQIDLRARDPECSDQQLSLMICRAMRAAFNMIKLRYFRHQPSPDAAWLQLFHLYKIAEEQSLLTMPVRPYEGARITTLSAVFVQGCMLDSVDISNLSRQEIDCIAEMLKKLMPDTQTTTHYDESKFLFHIDLNTDKGAKRIRHFTPTPSCRYWKMDDLAVAMDILVQSTNLPQTLEKFSLERFATFAPLSELIQHLHAEWSKTGYRRQRRKEERASTQRMAMVTFGIETICTQIKYLSSKNLLRNSRPTSAKSFDERLSSHTVIKSASATATMSLPPFMTGGQWSITDESPKGYGAIVSKEYAKPLKPDMLVGLMLEDERDMVVIGTIRSIKEVASGQSHIGLEVFSRQPLWVEITPELKKEDGAPSKAVDLSAPINFSSGFPGLLLPPEEGLSDTASLIVPRLKFQYDTIYKVTNQTYLNKVALGKPDLAKEDWARVAMPS